MSVQAGNVDMKNLESVARHVIYCQGRKQQEAFLGLCAARWGINRNSILEKVKMIRDQECRKD